MVQRWPTYAEQVLEVRESLLAFGIEPEAFQLRDRHYDELNETQKTQLHEEYDGQWGGPVQTLAFVVSATPQQYTQYEGRIYDADQYHMHFD